MSETFLKYEFYDIKATGRRKNKTGTRKSFMNP